MTTFHLQKELAQGDKLSVISAVNCLIEDAYHLRASDVHLDPEDKHVQIRFRIDGMLQDAQVFPNVLYPEIVSRMRRYPSGHKPAAYAQSY